MKRSLTVKRGAKRATIRLRLRNTGGAATRGMRLCAELTSKRLRARLEVTGRRCRAITVAAGQTKVVRVTVRIKRRARGTTTPVRIRVGGGNVQPRSVKVTIRARR